MTTQKSDELFVDGTWVNLVSLPDLPQDDVDWLVDLDPDVASADPSVPMIVFSTACWRRYIATWVIEHDRVYLKEVTGILAMRTTAPVLADWLNETLHYTSGDVVERSRLRTVREYDHYLDFENGVVVGRRTVHNAHLPDQRVR